MLDWPLFGYSLLIFFTMFFCDDCDIAVLCEWLANVVTISNGHLKNEKQPFKNVKGQIAYVI